MQKKKQAQIIQLLEENHVLSVKDLAQKLGCTEMTVRRNLDELAEMNFVKRERGYAVLLKTPVDADFFAEKDKHLSEKKAIAYAACLHIKDGQSICLDCGTTTHQMAELLSDDLDISVITSNLAAALALSYKQNVKLLLPEGYLQHQTRSLLFIDPDSLKKYHTDIAFVSCRSFRIPGGAFEHSENLVATKKALFSIADQRILLADHNKWNVNSICISLPMSNIDLIITDTGTPEQDLQAVAALGVPIEVVDPATLTVRKIN